MAKASWSPSHQESTHRSRGTKQSATGTSCRLMPRLAPALSSAAEHHSRNRCRAACSDCPSAVAQNTATAVSAHERVSTSPKLHCASTRTCAGLTCGKPVPTIAIHCYSAG